MRSTIHMQTGPPRRTSFITRYCLAAVVFLGLFLVLAVAPVSASLFPEYRIAHVGNSYNCQALPGPRISGHIVVWYGTGYHTEEEVYVNLPHNNNIGASAADISNIEEPLFLYDVPDLSDVPTWIDGSEADYFDFEGTILTWAVRNDEYQQIIGVYDLANSLAGDTIDNYPSSLYGYWPVTDGSVVVYAEIGRHGRYSQLSWTIHGYIPNWKAEFSLVDEIWEWSYDSHIDPPTPICIDGDTIVWKEFYTGKTWGLDVFERKHFAISYGSPHDMSGNLVLIEKLNRAGAVTLPIISYVDISDRDNPIEFPIATVMTAINQFNGYRYSSQARIDGNIVVWQDWRNGNWDIYGYDITSGTEFQITDDPGCQCLPDIDGNVVIWLDHDNPHGRICAANISSAFDPVCVIPVQGDLDGDCRVDLADFALLTQNWLDCNLDPPSACWE